MKKAILIVAIMICAVIFGYSAYELYTYYSADHTAEKAFEELLPSDTELAAAAGGGDGLSYENLLPYYERLRTENSDMVGWLRIPGTRISYPVMQPGKNIDPDYYLHRDFKKQYSANGTLYAADISDVSLPSEVVTIYGHRMKTGAMFGSFGDFLKEDFLKEHETIILDTFEERRTYRIFCLFSLAVETEDPNEFAYHQYNTFSDQEAFAAFIARARALKEIELPSNMPIYGEKILLLSTCEYTHENGRLVMLAVQTSP